VTDRAAIDAVLGRLGAEARTFARLDAARKAAMLQEVRSRFYDLSPRMVEAGNREKGVDARSPVAGEEWFSGPAISLRALRLFAESLRDVAAHGAPRIDARRVERTNDGRTHVVLTPHDALDQALFRGWRCSAWLEPEVLPQRISEVQASFYRQRDPEGRVVLVLGAGNVGSISVLDVLYHSFVEGAVCILKMSPVNAYLGPLYEAAFAPMIEAGYLAIVQGGAEVGEYLTQHPAIAAIHVTGSVDTHDNIVWGPPGPERERRRRDGDPVTKKRITSELGNVSPVLVVPAEYSERELDAAADSIVGMASNNASFNCNAAKMIVTARGFRQREELLARVRAAFARTPTRVAYYPGAHRRFDALLAETADARVDRIGEANAERLPWTLISSIDPERDSPLFRVEPFCPILGETALPADDAADFLPLATRFANDRLWGTLNVMLVVPSSLERDPTLSRALAEAVRSLRYGTVSLNVWPAAAYGLGAPPWGGYPGATLADVQSGIGWSHNAFLLDHVQKVVMEGPLLALPRPLWFPGHAHLPELGRAISDVEATRGLSALARAAWAALRP
jgi:acyl-CoA reductase-like NAD-dependent aldehyde dehydrogenase